MISVFLGTAYHIITLGNGMIWDPGGGNTILYRGMGPTPLYSIPYHIFPATIYYWTFESRSSVASTIEMALYSGNGNGGMVYPLQLKIYIQKLPLYQAMPKGGTSPCSCRNSPATL